jgi:hypothetical protein
VIRLFTFILALQILTMGQALGELVKLANLYEHFQMHRSMGGGMDLSNFIRMHYFDPEHQQSDPDTHRQLPLQQAGCHVNFVFQYPDEPMSLPLIGSPEISAFHPCMTDMSPQYTHINIFQPPRTAC